MDIRYQDVYPLVVPAEKTPRVVVIRMKVDHLAFTENRRRAVAAVRIKRVGRPQPIPPDPLGPEALAFEQIGDREIRVTGVFGEEGEYSILLNAREENGDERTVESAHIYALADDLFALRPFKGDFHMHSFRSDGRESPCYVTAAARRIGLDFMALTDHGQYAPSLEAIAFAQKTGTDMRCYPGEEVHLPDNQTHIIDFGASASVNDYARADEARYRAEVAEYAKRLPADPARDPFTTFQLASSEWAFDKIRSFGGISMFCHPYWRPGDNFYIGDGVTEEMMHRCKFDVLELFGGFYRYQLEANMLALSRWSEEQRVQARQIPVAGISDAHGCDRDLWGWYFTLVFAPSDDFSDLAAAIRACRCTAVQTVPDHFPIVAGEYRLVRFAYFLLREFYPAHDEVCRRESEPMSAFLANDMEETEMRARLDAMRGGTAALFRKYWAEHKIS